MFIRRIFRLFILLNIFVSLALVSACAGFRQEPIPIIPWKRHYNAVNDIKNWNLKGKISIADGNSRYSAIVDWNQVGSNYKIKLNAPIGSKHAEISKVAENRYKLITSDGKFQESERLEDIMQQEAGFSVSLQGFSHWIKAIPFGLTHNKFVLNKYRKLEFLSQDGWDIEYSNYDKFNGVYLPTKINFQNKNVKIKLLVKSFYY